jgi:CDGSH-type Zn-finger protein
MSLSQGAKKFELKPGIKVSLCSCGFSKTLPYCDNTHREVNALRGTDYRSIKIYSEGSETLVLSAFSKAWKKSE